MKKRDYSNPHTWQQPHDEHASVKPQKKSKRSYLIAGAALIVIIGFLSFHHQSTPTKQTTVAKKTGPHIQAVTLPIHQKSTKRG